MKTYYKNPRTGTVTEFDSENNTAVELVKIGELVEVPAEEEPEQKRGGGFKGTKKEKR